MSFLDILALAFLAWLFIAECSGFALLVTTGAKRAHGEPLERLCKIAGTPDVRFYIGATDGPAATAITSFWHRIVIIDVFAWNTLAWRQLETLIAHELGHHYYSHSRIRWIALVTGFMFIAPDTMRRLIDYQEFEADQFAERLVGGIDELRREIA